MVTTKKNQHYIPKFYLRKFSYNGNNKQIGLFNTKSRFFYSSSSLKKQCSKNFYYGLDGKIEDSLSKIENILARDIDRIISSMTLPYFRTTEHYNILSFISLTFLRNPTSIQWIKDFAKNFNNNLSKVPLKGKQKFFIPEIEHDLAVRLSLSQLEDVINYISDLRFKLLINDTKTPFITSDMPVVKYNQFLEKRKWHFSRAGYGIIGLQIILPLNPDIALILYDSKIYKVGSNKKNNVMISDAKDIDKINELQFVNCIETVYFNESITEHYIKQLYERASSYNKANQIKSNLSYLIKEGESPDTVNKMKNFIVTGTTDCETNFSIKGVKLHSGSKKVKLNGTLSELRPWAQYLTDLDRKNNRRRENAVFSFWE